MAESGFRPGPTPRANIGEHVTGQAPCYGAHGVLSELSQAGVLCASVPHLPGGSGHPARTGCASSALETASASGASAKDKASCMSP